MIEPVTIELTEHEMFCGAMTGQMRWLSSMSKGEHERNGAERQSMANRWFDNVLGALGEVAAAKVLGLPWPATLDANKHIPDIPPDWQVRTVSDANHMLIVRKDDRDDQRFILVVARGGPVFTVVGWITGGEAKRRGTWGDKGDRAAPCWWVRQSELHPMRLAISKEPA